jgi:hypothetical protein
MSHALADVVHAEQFRLFADNIGWTYIGCPACDWLSPEDVAVASLADGLAAARAHIAEAHTAALSYDTESTTAAVLHAVDNLTDGYPALIPADQLTDDDTRPVRRCDATGNTIRGPVVPVEEPGQERKHFCLRCFDAYRRSVAHLDDPLPLSEGPP